MKRKAAVGAEPDSKELTFAWRRGDEALVRFWCALLLVCGIFVALWYSIRIVVPATVAPDRPRVGKAKLIYVNEESHPSLQRLLAARNLPVLGVKESVGNAPLVDDMLSLLGLEDETGSGVELYPTPEIVAALAWPEPAENALTLSPLLEVDEESWPRVGSASPDQWQVRVKGQGKLAKFFKEWVLAWKGDLPSERKSRWSLVFDVDGALAFAAPAEELDEEAEAGLRRLLEEGFRKDGEGRSAVSGLVEIEFVLKVD